MIILQWYLNQYIKELREKDLKLLMIQRLPVALAQVKADNNSENLLNEIKQIVHSLY